MKTNDELDATVYKDVVEISNEWENNIKELNVQERTLDTLKEYYEDLSEKIIAETDFKALYGANNKDVRKNHVRKELSDMHELIRNSEYEVEYLKRRISFLKAMVYVKLGEK